MSDEKPTPAEDEPVENTDAAAEQSDDQLEVGDTGSNDAAFSADDPPIAETVPLVPASEELQAELAKAKEQAIRAQAEMENVRRRSKNEIDELRKYSALPVIRDVLGPIDNLRLALDAAEKSGNVGELVKGMQMVLTQFDGVFSNHFAKPIECEGKPFDPNHHEALQQIPSADHPPMTVLQEFQRGYTMFDRVIRPSKVIVSSAPPAPAEPETGESTDSDDAPATDQE